MPRLRFTFCILNLHLPLEIRSPTVMLPEKRGAVGKLSQFSVILYHMGIKEAEAMVVM